MEVVMIWNRKGGVGKSTIAVNLCAALSQKGKRVLCIDLDGQANLSYWIIQNKHIDNNCLTTTSILIGQKSIVNAYKEIRQNFFLVRSDKDIIDAEKKLNNENILMQQIEKLKKSPVLFNYVFVDCAPSYNKLHDCVLKVATKVIIPVNMEPLALVGTLQVYQILKDHKRFKDIDIIIIPTFIDRRYRKTEEILDALKTVFKDKLTNPIRVCSKLSEAPSHHKTIFEYAPRSTGAEDFDMLADWMIYYEKDNFRGKSVITATI